MGKAGTQNWPGKSGKTYSFNVWTIDTSFKEVECVYIYTKDIGDSWQLVYVGQTEHLATRLEEHENGNEDSDKCIQRSGATHIHVHQESSKLTRILVETDLRNNFKWSCNMQR
jgi:predicted GIY-YIG superfamily endonuclease